MTFSTQVKSLGVTLDNTLSFAPHIKKHHLWTLPHHASAPWVLKLSAALPQALELPASTHTTVWNHNSIQIPPQNSPVQTGLLTVIVQNTARPHSITVIFPSPARFYPLYALFCSVHVGHVLPWFAVLIHVTLIPCTVRCPWVSWKAPPNKIIIIYYQYHYYY